MHGTARAKGGGGGVKTCTEEMTKVLQSNVFPFETKNDLKFRDTIKPFGNITNLGIYVEIKIKCACHVKY